LSRELDEIWALYADDGGQSLDLAEQSLMNLKKAPADNGHLAALFRAIHTFKGNARVLGLATIERCAHAAEDLIGMVRDENVPLDPDILSLMLETSDALREMMSESLARRADPAPEASQALVARINTKIEQCRAAQRGEPVHAAEPQAIIFEPVKEAAFAQDTQYLQIFAAIASDGLNEARAALNKLQAGAPLDRGVLVPSLEHLRFAAGQMGLPGWQEVLQYFLSLSDPSAVDLKALIKGMEGLIPGDTVPGDTGQPQPEAPAQMASAEPAPQAGLAAASPAPAGPGAAKNAFRDLEDLGAEVFAPLPGGAAGGSVLATDPTYRAIYFDMVHDILREMWAALGEFEVNGQQAQLMLGSLVERLQHAARQLGMSGWLELLAEYPRDREVSFDEAKSFVDKVEAQAVLDAGESSFANATRDEASGSRIVKFFESLPPLLASVSSFGSLLANGIPLDAAGLLAAVSGIASMATSLEFVRIADIAEQMAKERQFAAFRRLELRLYEELVSVEQAMRPNLGEMDFDPAAVLQNWCADQAYDTLIELDNTLEEMHKHGGNPGHCEDTAGFLRLIYYACRHYSLETAAHLSMSLIDLYARARDEGTPPDPLLLRITGSFLSDLEMLFDTVGSGGTPDMAEIEKLFEQAANVTFAASGTPSCSVIETRLGLPKSFRKVLTPESLKTATAALEQGQRFYIVRAALNRDEQVASRFLGWVNSGAATVISNVTVFDKINTLFDFLLATPLSESELAESLAALDPDGSSLKIEMALNRGRSPQEPGRAQSSANGAGIAGQAAASQDMMPRDILEGIGEIVTGQAMIYRTLGDIAGEDLMRTIEAEVLKAGGDWSKAKGAVRSALEGVAGKIEKAYQAEAQIGTQLERLQEEAIAVRARPATLLTKPLEAFAEATARQHGRQVQLQVSGDDLVVDYDMLEELKPHLRTLIGFCVSRSGVQPTAPDKDGHGRLRLALARNEERVVATVDDSELGLDALQDGDAQAVLDGTRTALRGRGGELRIGAQAGEGVRFEVILPMAMVVLDGMVVRVGEFRYVVPLDAIQRIVHSSLEDVMRLSAGEGRFMLKLGHEEVLPVHCLRDVSSGEGINSEDASGGQRYLFVVIGKQSHRVALLVDELMGQQLVLIRPLRGYLTGIRGVTGCALLGGGDVGMVLDIGSIVNTAV
jgi:two-component system chemotaxis sensor kinase CheA